MILGTVPISQQCRGRAWGLKTMQEHFLCSWVTALGCQHSQHSMCGARAGLHALHGGSCAARSQISSWQSLGMVPGLGCTLCMKGPRAPDRRFHPGSVWEWCQGWLCPGAEELRVKWRV